MTMLINIKVRIEEKSYDLNPEGPVISRKSMGDIVLIIKCRSLQFLKLLRWDVNHLGHTVLNLGRLSYKGIH